MAYTEIDLEQAEREVRRGEQQVRRQRQIIAELKLGGCPTAMAEGLLAEFDAALHDDLARRVAVRVALDRGRLARSL